MYRREDIIKPGRAVGNTTRLVDYYIQELFNNFGKFIKVRDHYPLREADEYLYHRILNRLVIEHGPRVKVSTDWQKLKIKINYEPIRANLRVQSTD